LEERTVARRSPDTQRKPAFVPLLVMSSLLGLGGCTAPDPPAHAQTPAPQPAAPTTPVTGTDDETGTPQPNPNSAVDQSSQPASDGRTVEDAERERNTGIPEGRNVVYRVTPEGLIVDVEGVRFEPSVEAVKMKGGAWGVKLTVKAKSTNDGMHNLLSPKEGPLSIAGYIETKDGQLIQFSDQRDGDDELFVAPGQPLEFERTFPSGAVSERGGAMRPLYWHENLTITVGLWGLGVNGEQRRPLQRLFVVRMKAGNKPQPVVSAPEL